MDEINEKKFKYSLSKKINIKMSNMNMKIVINKNNKIKKIRGSLLIDKSDLNKYILPAFTKKIFNSLYNLK